jgi:hypothetical protein
MLNLGTVADIGYHIIYSDSVIHQKGRNTRGQNNKRKRVETAENAVKTASKNPNSKKMKMDTSKNVNLNVARTAHLKISDTVSIDTFFRSFVKTNPLYVLDFFSKSCVDVANNRIDSEMKLFLRKYNDKYNEKNGEDNIAVGCVAWMSDQYILESLYSCHGVSIIVNREDYDTWGNGCVKKKYPRLKKMPKPMYQMFGHLGGVMLDVDTHIKNGASSLYPVRAFGNDSNTKKSFKKKNVNDEGYGGLEHCKYLIWFEKGFKIKRKYAKYGRSIEELFKKNSQYNYVKEHWDDDAIYPFRVWTGSMNFTGNAKNNHDNAQIHVGLDVGLNFYYDYSVTYITSTPVFSKSKASTPSLNF